MTTQSILILAGIVSTFVFFGITLAWADYYSQHGPKTSVTDATAGQPNDRTSRDERRAA